MDVLADALIALRPKASLVCVVELGAPWGASAERGERAVFQLVQRGRCCVTRPGGDPVWLERGDLAFWPHGSAHELRDAPRSRTMRMASIVARAERIGAVLQVGDGRHATLLCGTFELSRRAGSPLLESLPELIVIRAGEMEAEAPLGMIVRLLVAECARAEPGATAVIPRLTDVLLVHVLRRYAASAEARTRGFLGALADARIGRALAAVHGAPAHAWTVAELAARAGMSRSAFAERFRALAGATPLAYVARWRVLLAAQRLAAEDATIEAVAGELGYASMSAFHAAFRKWLDASPGEHRRREQAASRRTS